LSQAGVLAQLPHDRRFVREHPGPTLRMDELPIDGNLKNPAARSDLRDLSVQLLLDSGRQTGGPLTIASLVAVFDGDSNGHGRLSG
jgi:hypothetical protein